MNTVECASEDESVVRVELLQTRCEGAIVDEPTRLVDDKKSEDDPERLSVSMQF